MVLLARTGLLEANPTLATNRRSTVLHVDVLTPRDMGALLDGLVHGLPDRQRDSLVERSEGIPLFAVETVRSLIDRDLVIPRGGQYVLADPDLDLDTVASPASLQALISARLDTLTPDARRVVDQASVVGNSFSRDAIASLCPDVADLDAVLGSLVRLQLLRQESNRYSSEVGQLQFVQGVVRQVAYGTISRRDRKASHLAVVRLLEEDDDGVGQDSSIIAQHYLEALGAVPDAPDAAQLTTTAVSHLERAAVRASALGAPEESAGHLRQALARCLDPHRAAVIEAELAEQLLRTGDHDAGIEHAAHARDDLDRLGDPLGAARAVATLSVALTLGPADFTQALQLATERFDLLEGMDEAAPVQMLLARATVRAQVRTGADLLAAAERQARIAERVGTPSDVADSFVSLALHYLTRGPRSVGRMLLDAAASIAREAHDNASLVHILSNLNADWTQDDALWASQFGRDAVEAGRRTGDPSRMSLAVTNLMLAQLVHGDWDELETYLDAVAYDEFDVAYFTMMGTEVAAVRGEHWVPRTEPDPEHAPEDRGAQALWQIVRAQAALNAGDPEAGTIACRAAELQHEATGLVDDIAVEWQRTLDIAWD